MQAQVRYNLSEAGRKASLLSGGDGKADQVLTCEISAHELADCHVNGNGEASFTVFSYDCSSLTFGIWTNRLYLDAPLTSFAEAAAIVRNSRAAAVAKLYSKLRAKMADKVGWKIDPVEDWYPDDLKQEIADHNERVRVEEEARQAAKQAVREEADRIDREKQAKRQAEKAAWIAENGSECLKLAAANGYNCERRYVTERAALEFPGFVVDFDDNSDWKSRSCPSDDALREAVEINKRVGGDLCKVVWLTEPVLSDAEADCEALVVNGFLGKYDLVKIVE